MFGYVAAVRRAARRAWRRCVLQVLCAAARASSPEGPGARLPRALLAARVEPRAVADGRDRDRRVRRRRGAGQRARAAPAVRRARCRSGIAVTAFDTLLVLGLQGRGLPPASRRSCSGLVATIGALLRRRAGAGRAGLARRGARLRAALAARCSDPRALYIAIGILGATVMPHNLYLHSSIVQTRRGRARPTRPARGDAPVARSTRSSRWRSRCWSTRRSWCWRRSAFHAHRPHARSPRSRTRTTCSTRSSAARSRRSLFGVALLASGQSSTFTGTIAGPGDHGRLPRPEDPVPAARRPVVGVEADRDAAVVPFDDRPLDHAGLLAHQRLRRGGVDDRGLLRLGQLAPGRALAIEHALPAGRGHPGARGGRRARRPS